MFNLLLKRKSDKDVTVAYNVEPFFIVSGNQSLLDVIVKYLDNIIGVMNIGRSTRASRYLLVYGKSEPTTRKLRELGISIDSKDGSGYIVDDEVRPIIKSTTLFSRRLCFYTIDKGWMVIVCAERV